MTIAQAVLGALSVVFGLALILASQHMAASSRRRKVPIATARLLWIASGVLLTTNGVLQLVLAASS